MSKKRILMIDTGGTISCTEDEHGNLISGSEEGKDWIEKIQGLDDIVDFKKKELRRIDSTEMTTADRAQMANMIRENSQDYDGFVIAHGTDSLTETACALNYMVQDLGKPIILTGSQKSVFEGDSDGMQNAYEAVVAAASNLGEVAIVFRSRILRGCRSKKFSEQDFDAFRSYNVRDIGRFNIHRKLDIESEAILRDNSKEPQFFTDFDTNVLYFDQSSGATHVDFLDDILEREDISGVLFGGLGAGNVQPIYAKAIEKATKLGKPCGIITVCDEGFAEPLYSVAKPALEAGAFQLGDMSKHAAFQKMMYSIGKANSEEIELKDRCEYVERTMVRSIGGDINLRP